ncbi:Filamin/ABP280 repeat-containing protein [Cryptosporidium felis]|nr:Filamin/ABP280 repeat-containing protein [Cryptosporidium felis]
MAYSIRNNDESGNNELFSGLDPHRFVPLNSNIAKKVNTSIPMGVYGGTKKNESFYLNSSQNSTTMEMELVPIEHIVKSGMSSVRINNTLNEPQLSMSENNTINSSNNYSFDIIRKHYFDERYLPNEYGEDNLYMKKSLLSKKNQGEITIKQLIKQSSGIMTEEVARNCRVTGIGLKKSISGEITQIMIYTYSENSQRITYGGYSFRVLLTPYKQLLGSNGEESVPLISLELMDMSESFEGSVVDNHDGTYTASYICKRAVPHRLEIFETKNKIPLGESPFVIQVSPGKAYPEFCWAKGEGLINYNTDGTISTFKIYSVDRMGNRTRKGGDKYEVSGIGGIKIQQILDLKNGEYEVYYKVHECNLSDYKEINIKLYGQLIKTPVFYPVSKDKLNDVLTEENSDLIKKNNLLNRTILQFDNLSIDIKPAYNLLMVFKNFDEMKKMGNEIDISIPSLPPFPENKENITNKEIIESLSNINESKKYLVNDDMILNEKIRVHILEDYKKNSLKRVASKLIKHEEILNDLSKAIIMHCEKGKEHDEKLYKDERKLESELDQITDCQQRMFATYSCLQQGGIDSLPVSFELEDPEKVKARQMKDRKFYIDTYNVLEKKFEEIKLRKESFEKNRDEYTQKLHRTLATRQKSIIKTQRSYSKILEELDKVYLQLSKKQTRRQDLYKNLGENSLKVFEGLENQKIIDKYLKRNVIKTNNEDNENNKSIDKDNSDNNLKRITGKDRRYNSYSELMPTDPESPAFWFAEASYLRDEKEKMYRYKKHEDYHSNERFNDDPKRVKRWDLDDDGRWISCPSSVSISFSTMKTPEIQPIKQKGLFKTDAYAEDAAQIKKEVSQGKKRDPMLPDNMDIEEVNEIIQKERKNSFRNSNIKNNTNLRDGKNTSPWVKTLPNPLNIKSFYDKSLDTLNEKQFKVENICQGGNHILSEENYNIDINLLNEKAKILPDIFWDRDFIYNLNKDARKAEDFEKIKNIWETQLKSRQERRNLIEKEKVKLMEIKPMNEPRLEQLNAMEYHDESNAITNKDINSSQDLSWKNIHHTFESDPRDVPWEFLEEITKMDTLPNKELTKTDLQKYIVESLVLDGISLSKKREQIKEKIIQEERDKFKKEELVAKKEKLFVEKEGQKIIVEGESQSKHEEGKGIYNTSKKNKLRKKETSREKARVLLSKKQFDTRREQFEHDNYGSFLV